MKQPKEGESCGTCGKRSEKYNGWPNYETWNVALWINNEEGTYNYWREKAREALENAEPAYKGQTKEEAAICALARELEAEIKDGAPTDEASMYSDILGAALGSVDWYNIAENWIEEAAEIGKAIAKAERK